MDLIVAKDKNVEIECPECGTNNAIPLPWGMECQKCNAKLKSGKYSKRMISAWTALIIGVGGTIGASQLIGADRYSIEDEYTIIDACINESKQPMSYTNIIKKRDVCACALADTQDDFDADAFSDKATRGDFIRTFEKNAARCSD